MPTDENPMKQPLLSYDSGGKLGSELDILDAIDAYRKTSHDSRWSRFSKNKQNWDFYHGRQDWSHKMKHQSRDFMPDFPMAVERIGLTFATPFAETSDWFDVTTVGLGAGAFDPVDIRKWLQFYLDRLYQPGDYADTSRPFSVVMSDAAKMGVLEAVICFKVYAVLCNRKQYLLESGNPLSADSDYTQLDLAVKAVDVPTLRLAIDLVPWEDYYPDPSGSNLFDIHEKTVTLAHLRDNPDYDERIIDGLANGVGSGVDSGGTTPEYEKRRRNDQDDPGGRMPQARIRETWGDIVDMRTGKYLIRNHFMTTTTGRDFLREPVENPFWHGRRPFVCSPILRVPLSSVHKAIADHAVPVARAMNELDNLMLDGAISSVWGIRQVKPDLLENPEEIDDGIPQGYTGVLKAGSNPGEKFLERVDAGEIPQYAVEMQRQKGAQFQTATALPDTAQGNLPPRQVKATEIQQTSAAAAGIFAGLATFLERSLICPTLELAWMTLWQYVDDFLEPEVVQVLGADRAMILQAMPSAERFVMMAQSIRFDVKGLRQLAQSQEMFSRLTTFLQSLGVNPALMQAFDAKYDVIPYLDDMMKAMRLDPARYEKKEGQGSVMTPEAMGIPPSDAPIPAGGIGGGTGPGGPTAGTAQSPGTNGTGNASSSIEAGMAQANPTGFRGGQL